MHADLASTEAMNTRRASRTVPAQGTARPRSGHQLPLSSARLIRRRTSTRHTHANVHAKNVPHATTRDCGPNGMGTPQSHSRRPLPRASAGGSEQEHAGNGDRSRNRSHRMREADVGKAGTAAKSVLGGKRKDHRDRATRAREPQKHQCLRAWAWYLPLTTRAPEPSHEASALARQEDRPLGHHAAPRADAVAKTHRARPAAQQGHGGRRHVGISGARSANAAPGAARSGPTATHRLRIGVGRRANLVDCRYSVTTHPTIGYVPTPQNRLRRIVGWAALRP